MFFIIELFSNNLFELFEFVINIFAQNNKVTIMQKGEQKERMFISTQYFRLNVYTDNDRKIFDKEDFGVEINTVLWFDVITTSNYAPVIISFLKTLMQNPTQVIAKSILLERISEDTPDCTDSSLKTHISHLRKKLRDMGGKEYIDAVWGIGFRLKSE